MPLPFVLLVLAGGVVLMVSGVADAEGGPLGLLGGLLKGETPKLRPAGDPTDLASSLMVSAPTGGSASGGGSGGAGSGKGAAAVAEARAQLGKPYRWGAEGPNAFDCSGLVFWCLKKAGLKWGRTTTEGQRTSSLGKTVSASQAAPGDVVFFGVPAYHDGIYIGGGQMIHAPSTGDVVKVSPVAGRTGPITYRRFL